MKNIDGVFVVQAKSIQRPMKKILILIGFCALFVNRTRSGMRVWGQVR